MTEVKFGDRVLVPRHFKPRGTDRVYDGGVVTELHKGVATIKLDDGRTVHTAVGLLSHHLEVAFGRCPVCGSNVTLNDDGTVKRHPRYATLGEGSRKCSGTDKARPDLAAEVADTKGRA